MLQFYRPALPGRAVLIPMIISMICSVRRRFPLSKTPMVSIIVPVYNASKTLRRCVDSVLKQEYADFELFLVGRRQPGRLRDHL